MGEPSRNHAVRLVHERLKGVGKSDPGTCRAYKYPIEYEITDRPAPQIVYCHAKGGRVVAH